MNFSFPQRLFKDKTDEELALLVQQGDNRAMEVLSERFSADVNYCADRVTDAAFDRDDLIQEGMIGLMSAARTYRSDENATFRTYANICIKNRIRSALRAANQSHTFISLDSSLNIKDPARTPEERFDDKERISGVKSLSKERLSKLEYEVLILRLNGDSYEQISEQLNISAKSVDNAVQRIRKKLKPDEI